MINIIKNQMSVDDSAYDFENKKSVVLVIGVNGVGKTTTIGKSSAAQYRQRGKKRFSWLLPIHSELPP